MSEQATVLAIVPSPDPNRQRRPNRGMQGKVKGAPARIGQLLALLKVEKNERERGKIEAQAVLAAADRQVEELRAELLDVMSERDALVIREEERLRATDDDSQATANLEMEHRTQCLAILLGAAHAENLYAKYPDFNTRIKKLDSPACTRLLTEILQFPKEIVVQMAYTVASNDKALAQLCKLSVEIPWACVRALVRISMPFEGDARVRQIQANLERWQ